MRVSVLLLAVCLQLVQNGKPIEIFVSADPSALPFSYELPASWADPKGRPRSFSPGHMDFHSIRGPFREHLTLGSRKAVSETKRSLAAQFAPSRKRFPANYTEISTPDSYGFVFDLPYMKSPGSLYLIGRVLFKNGALLSAQLTGECPVSARAKDVKAFVSIVKSLKPQ
jgi:hypothetical protein